MSVPPGTAGAAPQRDPSAQVNVILDNGAVVTVQRMPSGSAAAPAQGQQAPPDINQIVTAAQHYQKLAKETEVLLHNLKQNKSLWEQEKPSETRTKSIAVYDAQINEALTRWQQIQSKLAEFTNYLNWYRAQHQHQQRQRQQQLAQQQQQQ